MSFYHPNYTQAADHAADLMHVCREVSIMPFGRSWLIVATL